MSIILTALKLPRSTYYHWKEHRSSQHECADVKLKDRIRSIWQNNYKAYGYPRITMALQSLGIKIGAKRVFRLMREMGIHSLMNRRFKKLGTHVDYSQRPNFVKRYPEASVWRTDITYLELRPGTWVYLSSVYEPRAHCVLAFKISRQMDAKLVVNTLNQALEALKNLTSFIPLWDHNLRVTQSRHCLRGIRLRTHIQNQVIPMTIVKSNLFIHY